MTPEDEALTAKVRSAVADALAGSEWVPAEGAVLIECVVACGWFDAQGDYGTSVMRCGSPWGTRGLLDMAVERIALLDDDAYSDDDE